MTSSKGVVSVRPMVRADLDGADEICRIAFGTALGVPDPSTTLGSAELVRTRWAATPAAAFAADMAGRLAGSNFAARWGSVGYFGPLTVHPDLWDQGIGRHLMDPIRECFETWNTRHAGLFTFPNSPKHLELYRRYGFWPRFLTAVICKPVADPRGTPPQTYATVDTTQRPEYLASCRSLTDSVYEGLDLEDEIESVYTQGIGDTVLLEGAARLDGLAVCHLGPGSEAGAGACYVKFGAVLGAVRPGHDAANRFDRLLDACEQLAATRGLDRVDAGMNLARADAYGHMIDRGYRTGLQGVAMHRPNESGYNRPGTFVIDDWR